MSDDGPSGKTSDRAAPAAGHFGPIVEIRATSVLDLVDRQIAVFPDAPAVVESGRTVCYRQLDGLADAVASHLRRRYAIGPGDTVLVAAEAGVAFTAVVLGTLRVGAAYLPVDLAYPAERIAEILRVSRARLMAVGGQSPIPGHAAEAVGDNAGSRITTLDELLQDDGERIAGRPAFGPDDTAYVIFTSGSTGVPKGILQTHRCLVNFVSWQVEGFGLGTGRRVLQVAPLTFDVSVQEIFSTLSSGGCLFVPHRDVRRDPRELMAFIIDQRIEVVDFPQSLIDVIMTLPVTFAHAPALRHIISAGETVRVTPALRELLEQRPEITLHNHYGPAENHMVASHSISHARGNIEPKPPVGSLVWNTYIYILGEHRRPVPDGQVGEVYIGGVGVARGYTDPELTKRSFVNDPFRPGARLYRTRDRGVWRPDNTLELLGRIDDLIKIRGNTVEPREVEEHLARCPGVTGAAVFGATRTDGAMELHAALVDDGLSSQEMRRALLRTLPDYMVPVQWWLVDCFPRSPNGKMDRKALPGPGARPLARIVHQSKDSR